MKNDLDVGKLIDEEIGGPDRIDLDMPGEKLEREENPVGPALAIAPPTCSSGNACAVPGNTLHTR